MKKNFRTYLLFLLLYCFYGQNLHAQEYIIENLSIEDGLPSLEVYNVLQDNNGYLWFSTDRGICRYDGYEFKNYDVSDGLPSIVVLKLYEQDDNEIWGVTKHGELFYFNTIDYQINHYKYNSILAEHINLIDVNSLYIDSEKSIYLGFFTCTGFLKIDSVGTVYNHIKCSDRDEYCFEDSSQIVDAIDPNSLHGFGSLTFTNYENPTEVLNWLSGFDVKVLGTRLHPIRYGRNFVRTNRFNDTIVFVDKYHITARGPNIRWKRKIANQALCVKAYENNVWVGLDNGVIVYSKQGEFKKTLLPGKIVSGIYQDHDNGMWFTTVGSGIYYIKEISFLKKDLGNGNDNNITGLQASNKSVFIQYNRVGRVLEYSKGVVSKYVERRDREFDKTIFSFKENFGKPLIVKDLGEEVYFDKKLVEGKEFVGFGRVKRIIKGDDVDVVFVGDFGFGTVSKTYDYVWNEIGKTTYSVLRKNGGWYVATLDGLYTFSDENSELISMSSRDSIFSTSVKDISGNDGYNVLATQGNGFVVFNQDSVFSIQKQDGLLSNILENIFKQNDSTYWISSYKGLIMVLTIL